MTESSGISALKSHLENRFSSTRKIDVALAVSRWRRRRLPSAINPFENVTRCRKRATNRFNSATIKRNSRINVALSFYYSHFLSISLSLHLRVSLSLSLALFVSLFSTISFSLSLSRKVTRHSWENSY